MTSAFFYSPEYPVEIATMPSPSRGEPFGVTGVPKTQSIVGFRIFQNVLEANVAGELDIVAHATAKASKLVIDYEAILISDRLQISRIGDVYVVHPE